MAADRERVLYDGAKKEGKLVWYTSLTIYKEMAKFFEAKYPGVTVELYRATAVNLVSRVLSEAQAKRYLVDVIETTRIRKAPKTRPPAVCSTQRWIANPMLESATTETPLRVPMCRRASMTCSDPH
jgi:hypothetical protein